MKHLTSIKELRELTTLNRKAFSEYFRIPYGTLTEWELGRHEAPDYVIRLLEFRIKAEVLLNNAFDLSYPFVSLTATPVNEDFADTQHRMVNIREMTNMSRTEFSEFFKIPYSTIKDWEYGKRQTPDYVLDLLEYYVASHALLEDDRLKRGQRGPILDNSVEKENWRAMERKAKRYFDRDR